MTGLEKLYKAHILKKRTYAFTLDFFLITAINKVIINSYIMYLETIFYHLTKEMQLELYSGIDALFISSFVTLFLGYFTISYAFGNGQSPGKLLFGLVVESKSTGNTPGVISSFMRSLSYLTMISTAFFFFFIPYFTRSSKGAQDWISMSYVCRKGRLKFSEKTNVIPLVQPVEPEESIAA